MDHKLTKRQFQILLLIYKFRFLTKHHIQQILGHKSSQRINSWLNDLYEQGYLGRHFVKEKKAFSLPAVYFLGLDGRKALLGYEDVEDSLLKRVYKEKSMSKAFQEKFMYLADMYCNLMQQHQQVVFYTKSDLAQLDFMPERLSDAYIKIIDDKKVKRYFLEIFDAGMPKYAVKARIEQYLEYYQDNEWESETGLDFPEVHIIYSSPRNKKIALSILEEIEDLEGLPISFSLTER